MCVLVGGQMGVLFYFFPRLEFACEVRLHLPCPNSHCSPLKNATQMMMDCLVEAATSKYGEELGDALYKDVHVFPSARGELYSTNISFLVNKYVRKHCYKGYQREKCRILLYFPILTRKGTLRVLAETLRNAFGGCYYYIYIIVFK
jgi:hypothetical protein